MTESRPDPGDRGSNEPVAGPHFRLAQSVHPDVVFTSLAEQMVPDVCDSCTIDLTDSAGGNDAHYRIAYPPRLAIAGGILRIADRAAADRDHCARVPFAYPQPTEVTVADDLAAVDRFHGHAVFVWHLRTPTRTEDLLAQTMINEAVQSVVWQRTVQAARAAVADAAHLRTALHSSRDIGAAIGILMHRHKLTQDQAFARLAAASQHANRKLRELALDVIHTGQLEPASAQFMAGPQTPGGGEP